MTSTPTSEDSTSSSRMGSNVPVPVPVYCRPLMEKEPGMKVNISVGSEPNLGSVLARAFGQKSSDQLAMPSKKLGSARHILQKKLGSARIALSLKKPSYLEK